MINGSLKFEHDMKNKIHWKLVYLATRRACGTLASYRKIGTGSAWLTWRSSDDMCYAREESGAFKSLNLNLDSGCSEYLMLLISPGNVGR